MNNQKNTDCYCLFTDPLPKWLHFGISKKEAEMLLLNVHPIQNGRFLIRKIQQPYDAPPKKSIIYLSIVLVHEKRVTHHSLSQDIENKWIINRNS